LLLLLLLWRRSRGESRLDEELHVRPRRDDAAGRSVASEGADEALQVLVLVGREAGLRVER
jgi:hypothetical protein